MFDTVAQIRTELTVFAEGFNWSSLDGRGSVRMLGEFATIKRLVDGLIAQAARRSDETNAHAATSDRSGIALAARLAGVESGQMKSAVETARKLDSLPATATAVRAGKLSAREAELVAGAAEVDPGAELTLLAKTGEGLTRLKDECQRVRARAEDADARRRRMKASRSLRMWSDADGMLHGRFALPTEIGAQVKANIDREVRRIFRTRRRTNDHEPHDRYAADALCDYIIGNVGQADADSDSDTRDQGQRRAASEYAHSASNSGQDSGAGAHSAPDSGKDHSAGSDPQPVNTSPPNADSANASRRSSPTANASRAANGGPANTGPPKAVANNTASSVKTNATVHILIDHASLMRGEVHLGETCEIPGVGPVDLRWVQSLLGSAFVTAIIKRGKDILTVAHLGRNVPVEVQTALIVSGRECCVKGCACRNYLERDHTHEFAKGGATSFANLDWLCSYHHGLKSAKGYQLGPKDPVTGKRSISPRNARAA